MILMCCAWPDEVMYCETKTAKHNKQYAMGTTILHVVKFTGPLLLKNTVISRNICRIYHYISVTSIFFT